MVKKEFAVLNKENQKSEWWEEDLLTRDEAKAMLREGIGKITSTTPSDSTASKGELYTCPDGNCGFATNSMDRYIDHRIRSKLFGVDKQIDKAIQDVKSFIQSDECINGICDKVSKKLTKTEPKKEEVKEESDLL